MYDEAACDTQGPSALYDYYRPSGLERAVQVGYAVLGVLQALAALERSVRGRQ